MFAAVQVDNKENDFTFKPVLDNVNPAFVIYHNNKVVRSYTAKEIGEILIEACLEPNAMLSEDR